MSVTALMGVSTQALFAAYRQVHTIGNNIANANTEGYSRQTAVQQTSFSRFTEAGYVGTGVSVTSVKRASNLFLTEQAAALKSTAAADQVGRNLTGQLEQIFGFGEAGLGNAATQVFGAFADLAINPSDLAARQAVLGRLDEFAALSRANGAQVQALQDNVRSDINGSVAEVNSLAKQVAKLNGQIRSATQQGASPNDLLDRRDVLVGQIAEQMDLQTFTYADGSMAVFVAAGQPLVLGTEANTMVAGRDPLDASRLTVGMKVRGDFTLLADNNITGGKLGGLLNFQNDDLLAARNRLGQMVTSVAMQLNEQQGFGLDLNGRPGAKLFDLPAPQALAAVGNAVDGLGNPISSITLSVEDPSALQASDYELKADPGNIGQYILTRLADGLVRTGVVSGDVVDGLKITDGLVSPSAGERFLLRGVAHVAQSLQLALRDPKGIAAAGPMMASANRNNTGTLAVAGVNVVATPGTPYVAARFRFTDDLGNYDVLDGGGISLGSGSWVPGQPLAWNGLSVATTGVPRLGDELNLTPTGAAGSNNANALTFAGLGDRLLVNGERAADGYASLLSDMGVRAQSFQIAADNSGAAATRAQAALTGEVGVNLDEEAARLIQFQQSYQAAAKVLQTAQTMLDTVLGLTR